MTAVALDVTHHVGSFDLHRSFVLERGVGVLFGPSGSGKSLTLSIIAGLVRPSAGFVKLAGDLVADATTDLHVPTQQRRLGMVFQEGRLFPHRTVLANVALAVRDTDRTLRGAVAAGWLERVGAGDLSDRLPRTLSGGQRQRVALARALAGAPRLMLLDEPFSALDRDTRLAMRRLLREVIAEAQVPTLLVTHDRDEADELADQLIHY